MRKRGLVLFAHGARDPRWAEPFVRIAALLRKRAPDLAVEIAYLELMTPNLAHAVAMLVACGCDRVRVVPVFLGQGGHVRRDLPALAEAIRAQHPALDLAISASIGEDDDVLAAIAAYCLRMGGA
jgi:sirohydrochlorin cobaltochelatase